MPNDDRKDEEAARGWAGAGQDIQVRPQVAISEPHPPQGVQLEILAAGVTADPGGDRVDHHRRPP